MKALMHGRLPRTAALIHGSGHNQSFDTAKSGNVVASPKNFTVGSTLTSDPAKFKIFWPWESVQDACINLMSTFGTSSALLCLYQFGQFDVGSLSWILSQVQKIFNLTLSEVNVDPTRNHSCNWFDLWTFPDCFQIFNSKTFEHDFFSGYLV